MSAPRRKPRMSLQRSFQQISPVHGIYRTIVNTTWLYPIANITAALQNTTLPYTFDGTFLTCPDIPTLINLYVQIWEQTAISQPIGNQGFSLGVGTLCQNFGKTLYLQAPPGNTVIKWRLVKQLTPQTTDYIPVPANSPNETIGYTTIYNTQGASQELDGPYVSFNQ